MKKLSLEEVTSLLGVSTDSVLNHIKKKRLIADAITNKGEKIYVFEFEDIRDFASEFLDMELNLEDLTKPRSDNNTQSIPEVMNSMNFESNHEDDVPETKSHKKPKPHNDEDNGTEALRELLQEMKDDYTKVIEKFSNYKEQAAFQIGQLKSQLENSQKMLTSGRQEAEEKEELIRKLKTKLKTTSQELEEEKTMLDKMSLIERMFKIKKVRR